MRKSLERRETEEQPAEEQAEKKRIADTGAGTGMARDWNELRAEHNRHAVQEAQEQAEKKRIAGTTTTMSRMQVVDGPRDTIRPPMMRPQPHLQAHPPTNSWRGTMMRTLALLVPIYFAMVLVVTIACDWGLLEWDGMPPPMPKSLPMQLHSGLFSKTKAYGDTLPYFDNAQEELTHAHGSYCQTLEVACQLFPTPEHAAFYEHAVDVWTEKVPRSCPRPQACPNKVIEDRLERHELVSDWQEKMAQSALAVGENVRSGVEAGDSMLHHLVHGTDRVETALKDLHDTVSSKSKYASVTPYTTYTTLARLCRFHQIDQAYDQTTMDIALWPACRLLPFLIRRYHVVLTGDLTSPLWTPEWVPQMERALRSVLEEVQWVSQNVLASIDTMQTAGTNCHLTLGELERNAGKELTTSAKSLHRNLRRTCHALQGDTGLIKGLELAKARQRLQTVDTAIAKILAVSLIVPQPRWSDAQPWILVFDPTPYPATFDMALELWRSWTLVESNSNIRVTKGLASVAVSWGRLER